MTQNQPGDASAQASSLAPQPGANQTRAASTSSDPKSSGPSSLHDKLAASKPKAKVPELTSMSCLKQTIKQQHKLINAVLTSIDSLRMAQERSKSRIIKDTIELVVGAVEALVPNRNALHGAFYEAEKAAIASLGGSAPTNQNAASLQNQEAILKICDELKTCLSQQQEEINALKRAQAGPTYPAQANAHRPAQRAPSSADGTQGSSNKMPSVLSRAPTNFKPHLDNTPVEPWVAVERKRNN